MPVLRVDGGYHVTSGVQAWANHTHLSQVPGLLGIGNDLLIKEVTPTPATLLALLIGAIRETQNPTHGQAPTVPLALTLTPVEGKGEHPVVQGPGLEDTGASWFPGRSADGGQEGSPGVLAKVRLLVNQFLSGNQGVHGGRCHGRNDAVP